MLAESTVNSTTEVVRPAATEVDRNLPFTVGINCDIVPQLLATRAEVNPLHRTARWLQWKNVALPPPGNARLDQDIVAQIFIKVRELYKAEGGKFPDPIFNLTWSC